MRAALDLGLLCSLGPVPMSCDALVSRNIFVLHHRLHLVYRMADIWVPYCEQAGKLARRGARACGDVSRTSKVGHEDEADRPARRKREGWRQEPSAGDRPGGGHSSRA